MKSGLIGEENGRESVNLFSVALKHYNLPAAASTLIVGLNFHPPSGITTSLTTI
jgi:hypothetical protein